MTWTDWACLIAVIFGFLLFLCGANFYNAAVGWVGVLLLFGGIFAFLAFYVHKELTKKEEAQNP